ncbi:MAG TPA: S8 family serine peptidase [Candidatus Eremiobacteraeota bacterium]|mgnify:CR=1 FL=1|nr:MAG: Subtilisin [bacterium ADurb.Bin363]HPZ07852.1 S8 family serine peptidase [Candidatus Eremiobacteraeota bacterium]
MSEPLEKDKSIYSLISPELAWGGSTGKGIRVAIVDSGIDVSHPSLKDSVKGGVEISIDNNKKIHISTPEVISDNFGHGTACAGIVRKIAPQSELYSVKVTASGKGKGEAFLAGLKWAIDNDMNVINLSLGTTNRIYTGRFFKLLEDAYYKGNIIVTAANNLPSLSLPSVFSSVIAVSYDDFKDEFSFQYHPNSKIEFDAPGIYVKAPWPGGGYRKMTGTSFAAPHISGLVALILSKHPGLMVFQVKAILSFLGKRKS